jgi:methyl-accepting chemotaxis protein
MLLIFSVSSVAFFEITLLLSKHSGYWCRGGIMRSMDPEERFDRFERQQEFLAASQAQHDARMAEISAFLAETSRRLDETSRRLDETARRTEENSANIAQLGDLTLRIGRIVEEQAKQMDKLTDRMGELAESQTRTDERLNALINVVERYFSNGRN